MNGDRADRLRVESVRVHRMPGIPLPGFELTDLVCADCTLITGPNGSGKTTAAKVIEQALGSTAISSPGTFLVRLRREVLDGPTETWTAECQGRLMEWRCDGRSRSPADAWPVAAAALHRFTLTDLLLPDDEDARLFTRRIADAMAGGFDLAGVRRALEVDSVTPRLRAVAKAVKAAHRAWQTATRDAEQSERRGREELPRLDAEIEAASRAGSEEQRLRKALDLVRLQAEQTRLRTARALLEIDDALAARVRREDVETATRLASAWSKRLEQRRALEVRLVAAESRCGSSDWSAAELTSASSALRTIADSWRIALDSEAATAERLSEARAERAHVESRLRDVRDVAVDSIGEMAPLIREADALAAEGLTLAAEREKVERLIDGIPSRESCREDAARADDARAAIADALAWLGAASAGSAPMIEGERRASGGRSPWIGIALGGAAGWAILGILHHPLWWVGVLLTFLATGFVVWRTRSTDGPNAAPADEARLTAAAAQREAQRRLLGRTTLPAPSEWTAEAMVTYLEVINRVMVKAMQAEESLRLHEAHERRAARLREDIDALTARRGDVERAIGITLPSDVLAVTWLTEVVRSVGRWQSLDAQVASLEARRTTQLAQAQTEAKAASVITERFGLSAPEDPERARDAADRLRDMADAAGERQSVAADLADRAEPDCDEAQREWEAFWSQRGLSPDDRSGLQALIDRAESARAIDAKARDCSALLVAGRSELGEEAEALSSASTEELDRRLDEAQRRREAYTALVEERARLQSQLESEAKGASIAEAHAALAREEAEYEDLMERERLRVARSVVLDHVMRASRDHAVPQVFLRARGHFSAFTSGRFSLEMEHVDGEPSLCAVDERDGDTRDVAQLSAGEHVQLMFAVRLAFLEEESRGCMLPVILDEVLATSDDDRAQAIMAAVVQVIRSGRQVIVLTAQDDERAKWRRALDAAGCAVQTCDLGEIRFGAASRARPLPPMEDPADDRVPPPKGANHAAYGETLGIAGIDPWSPARGGAASVWYAVDDPELLHALLSAGFREIGPLLNYVRAVGAAPCGMNEQMTQRVRAARRGIDAAIDAYREGRSGPVSFERLLESGAITSTFEERLASVHRECDEDPQRFLAVLEESGNRQDERAKGFRSNKLDELRTWLEAENLLPVGEALDDDGIRRRVRIALHEEIEAGRIDDAWIALVVRALPGMAE